MTIERLAGTLGTLEYNTRKINVFRCLKVVAGSVRNEVRGTKLDRWDFRFFRKIPKISERS